MTELTEIINLKKEHKKNFLKFFPAHKKSRAIILNYIRNPELKAKIDEACSAIGVFVLHGNEITDNISPDTYFGAIDACISDDIEKNPDLDILFLEQIVPILPIETEYKIKEFNPMKFEGEGFLFAENNFYLMFEKICRFLENSQYAGDRRTMIKNLIAFEEKNY